MTPATSTREVVPGGFAALPAVNTRLRVAVATTGRSPSVREAATRVEDVRVVAPRRRARTAEVVIAQPILRGYPENPRTGTACLLGWSDARGILEVPVSFVAQERIGQVLMGWRLGVSGPVTRIQRRAHARVDLAVPAEVVVLQDDDAEVAPAGVSVVRGRTVNLSEGGMLAVAESPAPAVGRSVIVRLTVDGRSLLLPGRVVRHQAIPVVGGPGRGFAVQFDHPDEHGDRIRRVVFTHQLRARRSGAR